MITENLSLNIGEKLTFFQLFTEKKWKIETPIIQRDYAQGRDSARIVKADFSTIFEFIWNIDLCQMKSNLKTK